MQFQVPQFIDVAPKIVGPLTLKQFLYLAAGAVPLFLLFFVLQFWLWIIIAIILGSAALVLAFFKFNGQPLPQVAVSVFNYFWKPRFYLWQRSVEGPAGAKLGPEKPNTSALTDLLMKLTTTTQPISKREKTSKLLAAFKHKDAFETFRKTTGERDVARRIDYR